MPPRDSFKLEQFEVSNFLITELKGQNRSGTERNKLDHLTT